MTTKTVETRWQASAADVSLHRALGHTELAAGRPELAVRHFTIAMSAAGRATSGLFVVPDLVEAAVRAGMPELVQARFEQFDTWAGVSESPLLMALAARSRALLSTGGMADTEYQRALDLHTQAGELIEQARTQMLYGEYLRRARRRSDARHFLTAAIEVFSRAGALTWADRARAELQAGARSDGEKPGAWAGLTAQQRRIVEAIGQGASNREVAVRLFLSPRTVDYHLRNVYMKFGFSSRSELIRYAVTADGVGEVADVQPPRPSPAGR